MRTGQYLVKLISRKLRDKHKHKIYDSIENKFELEQKILSDRKQCFFMIIITNIIPNICGFLKFSKNHTKWILCYFEFLNFKFKKFFFEVVDLL